jgi:hypothetical protein
VRPRAGGGDWPVRLIRGLRALCVLVAQDPVLARLAFVEVLAPGPAGVRYREHLISAAAEGFCAGAPLAQRPSRLVAEASIGAVWGVIQCQIAAGRLRELPQVAHVLAYLALAPAIGAPGALEAIAAERARPGGALV